MHSGADSPQVTIHIPAMLRAYAGVDVAAIPVSAATVRDALQSLREQHPGAYNGVCDETGAVRQHINLFINHSLLQRSSALQAVLQPGDILTIMTAVSGG